METDATRMCELLVGLGNVDVLSVDNTSGEFVEVTVRTRTNRGVLSRLRGAGRVEGMAAHTAGRSGLFRPASTVVLAQTTVAMRRAGVSGRVVDRGRPHHCVASSAAHPPGRPRESRHGTPSNVEHRDPALPLPIHGSSGRSSRTSPPAVKPSAGMQQRFHRPRRG